MKKVIDIGNRCTKQIKYYESGKVESVCYYLNGERHREDGPAAISYYETGEVEYICYYLNGKRHREDGLAEIFYYETSEVEYTWSWYLNGERLSKTKFEQRMLVKKLNLI